MRRLLVGYNEPIGLDDAMTRIDDALEAAERLMQNIVCDSEATLRRLMG